VPSNQTIIWIQQHAGLRDTHRASVSGVTGAEPVDREALGEALDDFVAALQALNIEMNGDTPSESYEGDANVPRTVAYSVGEVIRLLRDSGDDSGARIAETAWLAVLAGDIDDVRQHVREEHKGQKD
jgi:hypothetical protein